MQVEPIVSLSLSNRSLGSTHVSSGRRDQNPVWSRLWKPLDRTPNDKCPVCGGPVVVAPDRGFFPLGSMIARRTKQELIAACAVHGHAPFNDETRRFLEQEAGG